MKEVTELGKKGKMANDTTHRNKFRYRTRKKIFGTRI